MAEVSLSPSSVLETTKKNPKRRWKQKIANKSKSVSSERLDSLPWNQTVTGNDQFDLLSGSVEGGFLSLEEVDELEYCFIDGTPTWVSETKEENIASSMLKKRKRGNHDAESEGDGSCIVNGRGEDEKKGSKEKKKIKKRSNKGHNNEELIPDRELEQECDLAKDEGLDDDEICAWNEMRLHPLLIRSIRRLGFTKPTPIQKACIPVAAHHGKDVIGAAQTGSGKTLTFGLPILQRLLEEREKARRLLQYDTKVTGDSGNSHLRALILVPTRELALQVYVNVDKKRES